MEFYKEGRVLGITANTRLDLGAAQFNHKAAIILQISGNAKLEFYTKGTVSGGVTMAASGDTIQGTAFTNSLIPVRLAAVTPDNSGTGKIILFN
jgi:hypothetical protein